MEQGKEKKVKCPACNGTGKIDPPKKSKSQLDTGGRLSKAAKKMRKEGYKIREIAEILGYNHPGSVSHLLSKK